MNENTVYMIGHSIHSVAQFIELLRMNGVAALLDSPGPAPPRSRFNPRFNAKALEAFLPLHDIDYRHIPQLGGKDPRPEAEL